MGKTARSPDHATIGTPRHHTLRAFVAERRKKAGLTQAEVAARWGRVQSVIAHIESGQRRVDVVELLDLAEIIGFDPREAIKRLLAVKRR